MIVTATEFKSNLGKYLDMVATQESAANKAARINFFRLLFIVNEPLFYWCKFYFMLSQKSFSMLALSGTPSLASVPSRAAKTSRTL